MKKLYRSNTNKILAGVIGGLGEYFDIDPVLLRLAFLLLVALFIGLPAIFVYLIAIFFNDVERVKYECEAFVFPSRGVSKRSNTSKVCYKMNTFYYSS